MDEMNVMQLYIQDIEEMLKFAENKDIFDLFRKLYNKEQLFSKKLRELKNGKKIYKDLIQKIVDSNGGIKTARAYFRIRQKDHKKIVNKAMAVTDHRLNLGLLYNIPVNHKFCHFALSRLPVKSKRLEKLYNDIIALRSEIITRHLYLALNRAKIFSRSSFGSFSPLEDLVQIANESLILAVDHYVMEENASNFHVVAIGRMIASFIEQSNSYSAASIGPSPGKRLYRIRKVLQDNPNFNHKQISEILDIAEKEVGALLTATSYKSIDDYVGDDSETRNHEIITKEDYFFENQDKLLEKKELSTLLYKSMDLLSIIEKKVLILKGLAYSWYLENCKELESE